MAKDTIWPEESASPLGAVFSPDTPTLPQILVCEGLDTLQEHLRSGTLDLSAVERRFGKQCWQTKKVLLPALGEQKDAGRAFCMEGEKLVPPPR